MGSGDWLNVGSMGSGSVIDDLDLVGSGSARLSPSRAVPVGMRPSLIQPLGLTSLGLSSILRIMSVRTRRFLLFFLDERVELVSWSLSSCRVALRWRRVENGNLHHLLRT